MRLFEFLKLVQDRTRLTISVLYMKDYDPIIERTEKKYIDEELLKIYNGYKLQRVDVSENVMYIVIEEDVK